MPTDQPCPVSPQRDIPQFLRECSVELDDWASHGENDEQYDRRHERAEQLRTLADWIEQQTAERDKRGEAGK